MPRPTPTEAAQRTIERLRRYRDENIWIFVRDDRELLADAASIEARVAAGECLPLAGLTFGVKDNIDVAGLPTTAAHPAFAHVPDAHATVVARLVEAGALLVGKTNMDQFATGLVGTRSPYGAVSSSVDAERVSGGSSSGSAAAVGRGIVDFSLGTDTAGSGRVPAAFNAIVGLKPTLGLLPLDGVVPACPSYDTVSVFAATVGVAAEAMRVAAGESETDPHSRTWSAAAPQGAPDAPIIAVPRAEDLDALSPRMRAAFDRAVSRVEEGGSAIVRVDVSSMLDAARLLYDGGLVAERAWSYGEFLRDHPDSADPSVSSIAERAMGTSGTSVIRDQQRLLELTRRARATLRGTDALMIPTAPIHPTIAEVQESPIAVNSVVGTYTNFVNLMDMCAAAVPAEAVDGEGRFGVSFVAPAFHDQVVADLASRFVGEDAAELGVPGIDVAVFGAHLRGEPLCGQLVDLGARYLRDVETAPDFRMKLVEGSPDRPAVVRADEGASLPGELWRLSPVSLASFLTGIAAPLALGEIELADGTTVIGFTASVAGGEQDITHLGGWRAYRAALAPIAA